MRKIKNLLLLQLGMTGLIGVLFFLLYGIQAAKAACLGGIVVILPGAFFANLYFKHHGALEAKHIVQGFYKGEAVKLVVSAALFAVFLIQYPSAPAAFFITYILIQLTHWVTPWVIDNTHW